MRVREGDISGLNHQVGTRAQEMEEEKLLQDLGAKGKWLAEMAGSKGVTSEEKIIHLDIPVWRTGEECLMGFCNVVLEFRANVRTEEKKKTYIKVINLKDCNFRHQWEDWRSMLEEVISPRTSRITKRIYAQGSIFSNPLLTILEHQCLRDKIPFKFSWLSATFST